MFDIKEWNIQMYDVHDDLSRSIINASYSPFESRERTRRNRPVTHGQVYVTTSDDKPSSSAFCSPFFKGKLFSTVLSWKSGILLQIHSSIACDWIIHGSELVHNEYASQIHLMLYSYVSSYASSPSLDFVTTQLKLLASCLETNEPWVPSSSSALASVSKPLCSGCV